MNDTFFYKQLIIFLFYLNKYSSYNDSIHLYKFLQLFYKKQLKFNSVYNLTTTKKSIKKRQLMLCNYSFEKRLYALCNLYIKLNISYGYDTMFTGAQSIHTCLIGGIIFKKTKRGIVFLLNNEMLYSILKNAVTIFVSASIIQCKFLILCSTGLRLHVGAVNCFSSHIDTTNIGAINAIESMFGVYKRNKNFKLLKKFKFDFYFAIDPISNFYALEFMKCTNAFIFGISTVLDHNYSFDYIIPVISNSEMIQFFFLNLIVLCCKIGASDVIAEYNKYIQQVCNKLINTQF